MSQIKGKLTTTESGAEKPRAAKGPALDFSKLAAVYEVKGNGVTLDWTPTAMQAIKSCKECQTPAVVFEILTQTGLKKEVFRNDRANVSMTTGM